MSVNCKRDTLPTSIQAIPAKGLIDKPLILNNFTPLSLDVKNEKLRVYHANLDLMHAIISPEQSDYDW